MLQNEMQKGTFHPLHLLQNGAGLFSKRDGGGPSNCFPSAHDPDTPSDVTLQDINPALQFTQMTKCAVCSEALPGQDCHTITYSGTGLLLT